MKDIAFRLDFEVHLFFSCELGMSVEVKEELSGWTMTN